MTELTTAEKIAQLEWRLKAEPENLALWLALGHARQQRGDLQESLVAFERASKIAPTDL